MELERRVASALRAQTDLLESWTPDLAAVRRQARQQMLRRAALVATSAATLGVIAVGAVGGARDDRSLPPADHADSRGQVATIPEVRPEQVVVTPSVRSSVDPSSGLFLSASSQDPQYTDASEIELPLEVTATYWWEVACNGAPDAWFVVTLDTDRYFDAGRCDGEILLGPEEGPDGGGDGTHPVLRVFTTDEDPSAFDRCWTLASEKACTGVVEPRTTAFPNAELELRVYQDRPGPVAATMFGVDVHARAKWGGTTYSLTTLAAAATGAPQLSFRVDAATTPRIAQAVTAVTSHVSSCVDQAPRRRRELCMPTVELLIDGKPARDQLEGPFSGPGGSGALRQGEPHEITFRVVEGNPRNIELGVMVYEEDP